MTLSNFLFFFFFFAIVVLSSRPSLAKPLTFSFTGGFKEDAHRQFFKFTNFSSIDGGALQLTPDNENQVLGYFNKSGRVAYYKPFKLWPSGEASDAVASFNTTFVINIYRNKVWNPGEGLAFFIGPGFDVPPDSHGQWMGLTNAATDGRGENSFVAVEFDTEKQWFDPDDNHVGLNINSVRSSKTVSLDRFGFLLSPEVGTDYRVWISYNGTAKRLEVYLANRTDARPAEPVLSETVNLRDHVRRSSYIGFSGSTGNPGIQYNCVLEWEMEIEDFRTRSSAGKWAKIGACIAAAALAGVALVAVKLGAVGYVRKKREAREEETSVTGALKRLPGMAREFGLKELRRATGEFSESRVLGEGGFGRVYRGVLHDKEEGDHEIAVKKFLRENIKAKHDFFAELTIIHRLRHKHLVRLLGWCYEKGKLLLVYDYMPNGSLDKHLYQSSTALTWALRHKILAGVASALHYLHHDFDQKVVHRDLKASNVLLDADFNARLGDFGLARAIEDERNSYAELGLAGVPGTMGYVAPECFHTGKASPESDVFGFGAVVLEVVCGRNPGEKIVCEQEQLQRTLVDWVWGLHRDGRVLEAVDGRLGEEFVAEEAERLLLLGLACSHPVADERPQTRVVCQVIAGTIPALHVPPFKPVFTWPALGPGFDISSLDSGDLSNVTSSSF